MRTLLREMSSVTRVFELLSQGLEFDGQVGELLGRGKIFEQTAASLVGGPHVTNQGLHLVIDPLVALVGIIIIICILLFPGRFWFLLVGRMIDIIIIGRPVLQRTGKGLDESLSSGERRSAWQGDNVALDIEFKHIDIFGKGPLQQVIQSVAIVIIVVGVVVVGCDSTLSFSTGERG